ncbi:MAG: 4'-phosphopantetheinyl transferase superfamily protein [Prolixibacteraceae bacterium]|nr:4'-phosphopantetheinyl transferase superfamily protein [Prolixibacteraceae bacterium]
MAIKFIEHIDKGLLGFWEIKETAEQLLETLNPETEELDKYLLLRNNLRRKEWLAVRLLLQKMVVGDSKIDYDPTGKPYLVNTPGHISISHSSNCVVIYLHTEEQPGIDIELITRNVTKAARKFLSAEELNDCMVDEQLSNKDVMLRWCAKEAVFKMVPFPDIDFASQIACIAQPLTTNEGVFSATFTSKEGSLHIPLNFRFVGDILMVWGQI